MSFRSSASSMAAPGVGVTSRMSATFFLQRGRLDVLHDLRVREARQFVLRQAAQDLPAALHAFLQCAAAGLRNERSLELGGEFEIFEVKRCEAVTTDYARQNTHAHGLGIRRVKLVREAWMIGMRIALANALVHQP